MSFRATFFGALALTVGLTGVALAQPAPPQPGGFAAFPLHLAYRAIGAAEARGARGRYLDAARTHYRSALARFGRSDEAGAAREAGAAAALARAAIDERPVPVPRDLPTPPPLPARAAGRPVTIGGRPGPGGPMTGVRRFAHRARFDPEALARDAARENTPEANDLAKNAVDADIARERAFFAGNREEGMRQGRLARELAAAVRLLAAADHPEAPPRVMRRPMSESLPGPGVRAPG